MKVSLLNEKISIRQSVVEVDKVGNHKTEWRDYYTCYATISSESPQEVTDVGNIWDGSKIDFTIRYCLKVSTLTSTDYRAQFREKLYDIKGIDHMHYKKKCIKLHCQRVER